jgi:predicted PurR-regulated permease PerM
MEEPAYNKRESDILFKGISDNFQRMFDRMDKQDIVLKSIDDNQNNNQREIDRIKDTIADYPYMKEAVNSLTNYKWWIIGSIATVIAIGAIVVYLVNDKIDTKISDGINSAFNTRFSKIQLINNN